LRYFVFKVAHTIPPLVSLVSRIENPSLVSIQALRQGDVDAWQRDALQQGKANTEG
jgi:hypothetical protein